MTKEFNRRRFLWGSMALLGGKFAASPSVLLSAPGKQEKPPPQVKGFRILGRTGFKASDIGFGATNLNDPALLEAALDRGVNYIDTGENYLNGQSERAIGRAIKGRDRKRLFITTKLALRSGETAQDLVGRARRCLERLATDYIDCLMIHMPPSVETIRTPAFHEAVKILKGDGRVRFAGISNHGSQWGEGPESMDTVVNAAIEDGRFDVVLFVYNFMQREMGESILSSCRRHRVGATLMKTNPVALYRELQTEADRMKAEGKPLAEYLKNLPEMKQRAERMTEILEQQGTAENEEEVRRAAVKFVLSNRDVHTACLTMNTFSDLDRYLPLSGMDLTTEDAARLAAYSSLCGRAYCRHACGLCEEACPMGVPVNTIMRYYQYFVGQGREKESMRKYAALPAPGASACAECGGPCEQACPHGVPARSLLAAAHSALSIP